MIRIDTGLFADPENYEYLDDQTDLQTLTFDDLLSFAFQVAKGMEFLSSKNVRDEGPHNENSLHLKLSILYTDRNTVESFWFPWIDEYQHQIL